MWNKWDGSTPVDFSISFFNSQVSRRSRGLLKQCQSLAYIGNLRPRDDLEIVSGHPNKHYASSLAVENQNERFLLSGGSDGSLALYDLEKRDLGASESSIRSVLADTKTSGRQSHSNYISSVQWYPIDPGAFISASYDESIWIWDSQCFKPVGKFETNCKVYDAQMSSDGSVTALALADGSIRLLDNNSGDYTQTLAGHTMSASRACWNPTQPYSLTSCSFGMSSPRPHSLLPIMHAVFRWLCVYLGHSQRRPKLLSDVIGLAARSHCHGNECNGRPAAQIHRNSWNCSGCCQVQTDEIDEAPLCQSSSGPCDEH